MKPRGAIGLALLGGLLFSAPLLAAEKADRQEVYLAPGWGKLSFDAPPAGSYKLPALEKAAGGTLLNSSGKRVELSELLQDHITLLGFIYRTCDDVNGCPLSTMVLRTVANRLQKQPQLAQRLRLITISFDPRNDTPQAMAEYARSIMGKATLNWHFLTSESDEQIQPVLDAYQQYVVADVSGKDGQGKFSHILRVYLIDTQAQIRNIYSLSFLHPDILVNDVKTLLLEGDAAASPAVAAQ